MAKGTRYAAWAPLRLTMAIGASADWATPIFNISEAFLSARPVRMMRYSTRMMGMVRGIMIQVGTGYCFAADMLYLLLIMPFRHDRKGYDMRTWMHGATGKTPPLSIPSAPPRSPRSLHTNEEVQAEIAAAIRRGPERRLSVSPLRPPRDPRPPDSPKDR